MATERQIAANRRNARKSTGPRCSASKRRTSRNSYRHGLSVSAASSAERTKRIERLARKIAGNTADPVIHAYARETAQAEIDLAQIRRVKVALIERMLAFGEFQAVLPFESTREIARFLKAFERGKEIVPTPVEAGAAMPSREPERLAEAVRRALPELLKLDRYERRAAAMRERSVQTIIGRLNMLYNQ